MTRSPIFAFVLLVPIVAFRQPCMQRALFPRQRRCTWPKSVVRNAADQSTPNDYVLSTGERISRDPGMSTAGGKTAEEHLYGIYATVKAAVEAKGTDILAHDVRECSIMTSYYVYITGSNTRHLSMISGSILETLRIELGHEPIISNDDERSGWIIHDFDYMNVHVCLKSMREYYGLGLRHPQAIQIDINKPTREAMSRQQQENRPGLYIAGKYDSVRFVSLSGNSTMSKNSREEEAENPCEPSGAKQHGKQSRLTWHSPAPPPIINEIDEADEAFWS
eukprot:GHVU01213426.1.p1 GENE.GHVU01213426.1~~GHVU01213426.1.p1  ORF type:complete len:278 (+),score=26.46 GHVU01213426.1:189-1022(+)